MNEPRRILPHLRLLATTVVSVALLVGLSAPPALAATPPPPAVQASSDSGVEVAVSGPLLVLAAEDPQPGTADRIVVLQTPGGSLVRLDGVDPSTVATGDTFSGVIALDPSVAAAPESAPPISAESSEGQDVLAQSMAAELPVVAVRTEITRAEGTQVDPETGKPLAVAGAIAPRAHTVDVAVVGLSPATAAFYSDAQVNTLVAAMSGYWASQSLGAIPSFARQTAIKRLAVGNSCDAYSVWAAAANAFGHPDMYGAYNNGAARHLVVIAGAECGPGNGLGTVGSSVHEGGLTWSAVDDGKAASVVAHELGHNLGLGHSNQHYCELPTALEGQPDNNGGYTNDCVDDEYTDYYDVMSGGYSNCSTLCYTTKKITALNVAHKAGVGFLTAPALAAFSLPSTSWSASHTVTLQPISSASGVRGLRLVNPRDGAVYFVELRNGTGIDAGGFYTSPVGEGLGVRVLRLGAEFGPASRVLSPLPAAGNTRDYLLDANEQFRTSNRGITIAISSATSSSVTLNIQLNKADPFTSVADPRLSTSSVRFGATVTVSPGAATPAATGAGYQWLRSGTAISGATASTYTPVLADVGKKLSATVTVTRSGYIPTARTTPQTSVVTGPVVKRIAGADRYATAVALSKLGYPGTAPIVYVATGANFPDALAAAPAAATLGGPLLLSATDKLPAAVKTEIQRLKPARIVVVGGAATVSDAVLRELKTVQKNTVRLAGSDRFATANAIIRDAFPGTVRESWIATGLNFPDALSAAGVAGSRSVPVVMVNGAQSGVDAATAALLAKLKPSSIGIAGGTGVVSAGIENALKKKYTVTRYAGADRYATSEAVNATTFTNPKTVYLATGLGFADALAGAAIAGATAGPLYVIPPGCVPGGVLKKISSWGTTSVIVIGGPAVLSPAVEKLTRC